jgi:hypothetical protein
MSSQNISEKQARGAKFNQSTKFKQPAIIKRTASHAPSPSPSPSPLPPKYTIPSKETYQYRDCSHPIEEICLVTNYLATIPDEFKHTMLKFICQEGLNGPGVYAEYSAPPNADTVHRINGSGGYFLKKTAEDANIYLIWYNRPRGVYMFWGALEREVRNAMNRIRGRIVKYVVHVNSAEKPTHLAEKEMEDYEQQPTQKIQRQEKFKYNLSKTNIAASPPPFQNINPIFRSESMAVADAYDYSPENTTQPDPAGLSRSMSIM